MRVDIESLLKKEKKRFKTCLVLTIVFAFLLAASLTLLIIFTNYKIELLMKIVGSIWVSLLACVIVFLSTTKLIPINANCRFYKFLSLSNVSEVSGTISSIGNDLVTVRRGIYSKTVIIDNVTYYVCFDELLDKLTVDNTVGLYTSDMFVVGVKDE